MCKDRESVPDANTMPTPKLNRELLLAAIDGFEFQKLRIDAQIVEIQQQLDGDHAGPTAPALEIPKSGRKKFSAAARRKMAASQKDRWAKKKGEAAPTERAAAPAERAASPKAAKPKRKLSAAGRAAIVAALKKRWAAKKTASPAKGGKKKATKASKAATQTSA